MWLIFEHIMFFTRTIIRDVLSNYPVCVDEIRDNKKYCTLCCIKGLILLFTNIVIVSDTYNFKGSIFINY
jgi:hypothetical protein